MKAQSMEHVVVYRSEDHFCAWPFNGGMWQFSDGEIAVGFIRGQCDYATPDSVGHRTVDTGCGEQLILRSRTVSVCSVALGYPQRMTAQPCLSQCRQTAVGAGGSRSGFGPTDSSSSVADPATSYVPMGCSCFSAMRPEPSMSATAHPSSLAAAMAGLLGG